MHTPRFYTAFILSGVALVFATSASAGVADHGRAGTGSLDLFKGKGLAVITSFDQGVIGGRIAQGSVTLLDFSGDDPPTKFNVRKWGCEKRRRPNKRTVICSGKDLRPWVVDGAWRVTLRGRGINASVSVSGDAKVLLRGTRGTYSIDRGPKVDWPAVAGTFPFGG